MKNIKSFVFFLIVIFSFCSTNTFAQKRKVLKLKTKADIHFEAEEYEKAIEYYDKALDLDKSNFKILGLKGISYYELGNYKFAMDNFDLAIAINPKDSRIYAFKARCYNDSRDYLNAIRQYQKALEYAEAENYPAIYNNIGNAFSDLGRYGEGINAYEKAIELDENNYNYYYNLARLYSEIGEHEKAIEIDKITIRVNPKAREAYNNMGMNYVILKDYRQAIKMMKKALELEDDGGVHNKAYPLNNLAFCYLNINMLDKAIEYAEKSKAIDSQNSYVYFTLAGVAAFKKDHEGFYNQLIKAHSLGFPLTTRLDEPFLKPYLEEERFKSFLK